MIQRAGLRRVLVVAATIAACGEDPVEQNDPLLTLSSDSVALTVGGSTAVTATVSNASEPAQFVSRDQNVATVGANGTINGVGVGSTYVVASLSSHPAVRDSVRVRVAAQPSTNQTVFTYQNTVAYLPPGVSQYQAAIVFLPGLRDPATGNDLDSRPLVRGTSELQCSIWCSASERAQVRSRAIQLAGGKVALIGTTTLVDNPASYQTLLQSLTALGTQSLHPELANIPIFIVGHSMGGCTAYGFTRVHGARVAGFLTMKGGCHNQGSAAAAANVPGYFLIGALDEEYRRDNITGVFEAGRAGGAPWALSTDDFHHGPILDFDLMFDWIDTVLAARLPLTPGAPLRAVPGTNGWLGNRSSGAIATSACYGGNPLSASWLPTEETAINWQRMAHGTGVVRDC